MGTTVYAHFALSNCCMSRSPCRIRKEYFHTGLGRRPGQLHGGRRSPPSPVGILATNKRGQGTISVAACLCQNWRSASLLRPQRAVEDVSVHGMSEALALHLQRISWFCYLGKLKN